jgi:hypothetical protein
MSGFTERQRANAIRIGIVVGFVVLLGLAWAYSHHGFNLN